ncbi:MAG: choice-of-anchor D domain-containing protein [Candidatus Eisenbacteria bacterium]
MAPEHLRKRTAWLASLIVVLASLAAPAHALRVTTWNLLDYREGTLEARQVHFRKVMGAIDTDVLVVQELKSAAAADSFLNNVLRVAQPTRVWKGGASTFLSTTESSLYYDSLKVTHTNLGAVATGGPRQVLVALIKPNGYRTASSWFRLYSAHLKAGQPAVTGSPPDSALRRTECTNLRNTLNAAPANTNILLGGDMNFYGDFEGGYSRLTESQLDNDGRLKDPLTMPGTWQNPGYAIHHTQCPCITGDCPAGFGFSGGGLDDRFDMLLGTYSLSDGAGLDVVPGALPNGYGAYGNDGFHYNQNIDGSGVNYAVPLDVASALHQAADHIPVVLTLQLPPKLQAASTLPFGDVIVGGSVSQSLAVSNVAPVPADELDYSLSAPAGFSAPAGAFVANAGALATLQTIGMSTAATGVKSGTLTIASDDPDTLSKSVALSGRVLAHAVASLDSMNVLTSSTLDLGDHIAGQFPDSAVRVHNLGYVALQARLSLEGAAIVGGAGRFSLIGGFSSALLAGTGRSHTVHFEDSGATADSTYEATLTFTSSDEPLPGATSASPLVVTLRARRASGGVGVGESPSALRFLPPSPNPLHRGTLFGFSLPRAAQVTLAVHDLTGRRVSLVQEGEMSAGAHSLRWNAQDRTGQALAAGLYFVRFATPGLTRVERLVVLP